MIGHRSAIAVVLLAVLGLLGACSSEGSGGAAGVGAGGPLTEEGQLTFERAVALAACRRAHGIDDLPDPRLSGTEFMLVAYPLARESDAWAKADEACEAVRDGAAPPDGATGSGAAAASPVRDLTAAEAAEWEAEVAFTACLREHGVEGLPEPQLSGNGFVLSGVPLTPDAHGWDEAQAACAGAGAAAAQADGPGWRAIAPGGDCRCADGSAFSFWVRDGDPEQVVLFLQDGGACWSDETCSPQRALYEASAEGPPGDAGIFDVAEAANPFADHSFVYVPYCTADVHLGNATTAYAPDLTVHHKGYVNGTAALEHLASAFPAATDIVVIGESAGSIAAPLYAGLVADRVPGAAVTVLADGSGSYPDVAALNRLLAEAWGTSGTLPAWSSTAQPSGEQWSTPGLFVGSGRHDPDIVFARHDYAYDAVQREFLGLADIPSSDLLALIDANEAQVEDAHVELLSYVAPGDAHTVLSDGTFYREEVDGQRLVDWVGRLVARQPVGDVHCTTCTAR